MTTDKDLPALPRGYSFYQAADVAYTNTVFTTDQMHTYATDALATAQAEIERLTAMLKRANIERELWRDHVDSARAERDAALADARRYRWLREQDWFNAPLCVLRDPKTVLTRGPGLGADCPSRDRLDAAIDAALAATVEARS